MLPNKIHHVAKKIYLRFCAVNWDYSVPTDVFTCSWRGSGRACSMFCYGRNWRPDAAYSGQEPPEQVPNVSRKNPELPAS
jgi:hypothetical protein